MIREMGGLEGSGDTKPNFDIDEENEVDSDDDYIPDLLFD